MKIVVREAVKLTAWLLFLFALYQLFQDIYYYTIPDILHLLPDRTIGFNIAKYLLEGVCLYGWWRLK